MVRQAKAVTVFIQVARRSPTENSLSTKWRTDSLLSTFGIGIVLSHASSLTSAFSILDVAAAGPDNPGVGFVIIFQRLCHRERPAGQQHEIVLAQRPQILIESFM